MGGGYHRPHLVPHDLPARKGNICLLYPLGVLELPVAHTAEFWARRARLQGTEPQDGGLSGQAEAARKEGCQAEARVATACPRPPTSPAPPTTPNSVSNTPSLPAAWPLPSTGSPNTLILPMLRSQPPSKKPHLLSSEGLFFKGAPRPLTLELRVLSFTRLKPVSRSEPLAIWGSSPSP